MDFLETVKNMFDIIENIFEVMQESIEKVVDEYNVEANKIDRKWLETLREKCVLKTDNKVYTAKEAVIAAKKQRDAIIKILASNIVGSNTQLNLREDLTYLNKIISSYETMFAAKELDKKKLNYEDARVKKALIIENAIKNSILEIDKVINSINISDLYANINSKEDISILSKNMEVLFELKQFKTAMQQLLVHNGEVINLAAIKAIVEKYLEVITNEHINMNNPEDDPEDNPENDLEDNPENDPENDLEDDPEDDSEDDPEDDLENDPEDNPENDPEDNPENDPEDNPENDPENDPKNNPENDPEDNPEDDLENDPEDNPEYDLENDPEDNPENDPEDNPEDDPEDNPEDYLENFQKEEAKRMVEILETTEKFKDFKSAYRAVKSLPDCEEKNELKDRIEKVAEDNEIKFGNLMDIIEEQIKNNELIDKTDIDELSDRCQYLNDSYYEKIKKDYVRIVTIYNNMIQDEYQVRLTEDDIKKYSFSDVFREFVGSPIISLGTKIKNYVINTKINSLKKKLYSVKDDNEKSKYENRISKISKSISNDNDVISGGKLYVARNTLANKKFKLYQGAVTGQDYELTTDEDGNNTKNYRNHATDRISKVLSKGLLKLSKDESIFDSKNRVVTVLDQYLELVASGTYDVKNVEKALDYLQKAKEEGVLSESEFAGYCEELSIIYEYRRNRAGIPYHINDTYNEVDNVVKYYDSDTYNRSRAKYVK